MWVNPFVYSKARLLCRFWCARGEPGYSHFVAREGMRCVGKQSDRPTRTYSLCALTTSLHNTHFGWSECVGARLHTFLLSKADSQKYRQGRLSCSGALQAPQVTPPAPPHRTLLKVTVSLAEGIWDFGRYLVFTAWWQVAYFFVCALLPTAHAGMWDTDRSWRLSNHTYVSWASLRYYKQTLTCILRLRRAEEVWGRKISRNGSCKPLEKKHGTYLQYFEV